MQHRILLWLGLLILLPMQLALGWLQSMYCVRMHLMQYWICILSRHMCFLLSYPQQLCCLRSLWDWEVLYHMLAWLLWRRIFTHWLLSMWYQVPIMYFLQFYDLLQLHTRFLFGSNKRLPSMPNTMLNLCYSNNLFILPIESDTYWRILHELDGRVQSSKCWFNISSRLRADSSSNSQR